MKSFKIFSVCVFVTLFSSCATEHKKAEFQMNYSQYNQEVFERVRSAKLYMKLETVMIVDAIFIDKGLRRAWVEEQSRARHLGDKQMADILTEEMTKGKSFDQFVLAVYTSEDEWNDFADADTRWTVLLDFGGNDFYRPLAIEKVKLADLALGDHLPFDTRFRTFYKVNYPKKSPGSKLHNLTVSSSLGEVKLVW